MPLLKQGSSGPAVKDLQQKLKALGFDPNGVDGNFGPGTKAAVIAFQQSKGLQPDGKVGPATMAAIEAASGGAPIVSTGTAVSGSNTSRPSTRRLMRTIRRNSAVGFTRTAWATVTKRPAKDFDIAGAATSS